MHVEKRPEFLILSEHSLPAHGLSAFPYRPHRPERLLPTERHAHALHREFHEVTVYSVLPALDHQQPHDIMRRDLCAMAC